MFFDEIMNVLFQNGFAGPPMTEYLCYLFAWLFGVTVMFLPVLIIFAVIWRLIKRW